MEPPGTETVSSEAQADRELAEDLIAHRRVVFDPFVERFGPLPTRTVEIIRSRPRAPLSTALRSSLAEALRKAR